ncbi:P-loop containing nucleoside triphosphate hydrolases superfamily protein [Prunus dulcis]|uniref:P-loop containing nucleoside triphosphate hydrolases superfamily protein n=1 Tax=Prunus dulcis TaxID=3755 RepID=A0A4Y1RCT1_PRUDU|nr:P-loop containing nucleoside triphosphate hydrolases superfamily protein [Prunus dulcis]
MEGTGSGKKEEEINLKVTDPYGNEFVELERRRMEERILQQQQEAEMLRRRLEEIELELCRSGDGYGKENGTKDHDGTQFAKRLLGIYASDDAGGMVKSMDWTWVIEYLLLVRKKKWKKRKDLRKMWKLKNWRKKLWEEKRVCMVDGSSLQSNYIMGSLTSLPKDYQDTPTVNRPSRNPGEEDGKGGPDDRLVRIRNIFTLCGNYRELFQHVTTPAPTVASVKSETDRRDNQAFTFLMLGDPTGASVPKEKEQQFRPLSFLYATINQMATLLA